MKTFDDYLKKYTDDDRVERLQELMDEANRMMEVISVGKPGHYIHDQFLIWNYACWNYFQHHQTIYPGMKDRFRQTGVVPNFPKLVRVVDEVDWSLVEKIQSELQKRLEFLIQAKELSGSKLPIVEITRRAIVCEKGDESVYLSGKRLEIVLVLKRKMPDPVPMSKLAELVGYSQSSQRKVSDDKNEINKSFREKTGVEADLIVRVGQRGYSLNQEDFRIV